MGGFEIFEIEKRIRDYVEEHVDHETGELPEECWAELEQLEVKREDALLALGAMAKEHKREAEAIKEEAKRMRERATYVERRGERLRARIAEALGVGNKLKNQQCSLYWNTSERLELEAIDPEDLPADFQKLEIKADTDAIRAALKGDGPAHEAAARVASIVRRHNLVVR